MPYRLLTLLLLLTTPLQADDFKHLSGANPEGKTNSLKFTNTQKWGSDFLAFTRKTPRFLPSSWNRDLSVPAAPDNHSPRTQAELAYLKTLVNQRNANKANIQKEVLVTNFRFGANTWQTLTTSPKFKETGKLLNAAYNDLAIVVFFFKKKSDRVRPTFLDPELKPAIEIPTHPAYPSGHALSTFTIAYLLQELDPKNADRYLKDAQGIAHNREIAGLHYPSDTAAGQTLARQLTDLLLRNKQFVRQLEIAKKEW